MYSLSPHCIVKTCMGDNLFLSEIQNLSPYTTEREAREYVISKVTELTLECDARGEFWSYKLIGNSRVEIRHGEYGRPVVTSFEVFKMVPLHLE